MCRSVVCNLCAKRTWTGCGNHIPLAMSSYSKSEWCNCLPRYNDQKESSFPPGYGYARKPETPLEDRPESKYKKTWRGCGQHIPAAMSQSPKDSWCTCVPADGSARGEYPPMAGSGKKA
ncbi:uncharacterized protein KQ657_003639 [Scheffersomyces spartinae]|uniref:Uncharacterized protein n=1 Tax=Scheffersomyces spartinae TaxID=45513 RepID=A0A9P8AJ56_9ASCO|nr:uncharacterized protein KQ657_003639 [Scheffersomyces spartinae]KAG7195118.1 hypothetical protein KQ657_003639 [Scheffersomyces spartinae]